MNLKPIGPTLHGALDYGLSTLNALAPGLLNLSPRASTISYTFAATHGLLNALTDHPLAVKGLVPFKLHGQLELPILPTLLAVPWLAGAMKRPKDRLFFFSVFGLALTTFLLTDFDARKNGQA